MLAFWKRSQWNNRWDVGWILRVRDESAGLCKILWRKYSHYYMKTNNALLPGVDYKNVDIYFTSQCCFKFVRSYVIRAWFDDFMNMCFLVWNKAGNTKSLVIVDYCIYVCTYRPFLTYNFFYSRRHNIMADINNFFSLLTLCICL